jgi:3-phenylpropionate/cinnamic acid dioxygenase small subunit
LTDLRADVSDITDVLVRYATGIDRRDWALFRTCWADDLQADYGPIGQFRGPDSITEFMTASHLKMGRTHHILSNFVIDVDGDTATSRCYLHAVLMNDKDDPSKWMDVIGHYDDVLVRTASGWRISRRRARSSRVLTSP